MTPHREGTWIPGADRAPCVPLDGRRLALEAGAIALPAALIAAFVGTLGVTVAAVGGVALAAAALGVAARHADDRRRAMRERAVALRGEFGTGPAWIVDLMVRQGEAPTGCDQGLLWVEGGRVLYSGLRTSFALVPSQIEGRVQYEFPIPGLRHRLNLRLARETSGGPLSVSFWPIAESLRNAESDAANLRYALNALLEGRWTSPPPTDGQWPPVALGPDAPEPAVLRASALHRLFAWIAVALAVSLLLPLAYGAPLFLLLALLVVRASARENAPRWAAYRDARRVRGAL